MGISCVFSMKSSTNKIPRGSKESFHGCLEQPSTPHVEQLPQSTSIQCKITEGVAKRSRAHEIFPHEGVAKRSRAHEIFPEKTISILWALAQLANDVGIIELTEDGKIQKRISTQLKSSIKKITQRKVVSSPLRYGSQLRGLAPRKDT